MRVLVAIACAFGGGILVEDAIGGALVAWLAVTIATALLVAWRKKALLLLVLAGIVGGLSSSLWRARTAARPALPDGDLVLEGTVALPVEDGPGPRRAIVDVDGRVDGGAIRPMALRVRVSWEESGEILPGDRVRFGGVLREPTGYRNEGAFDRGRFLGGRGIDALIGARPPGVVRVADAGVGGAWRAAAIARAHAAGVLSRARGDGCALLQALVLGRRGEIRPELEDAFRRTGVSHVLSVSGLHLAAVALLLHRLVRAAWLRSARLSLRVPADRAAALLAIPAAVAYTMITGGEVATVRALVCAVIVLGGAALGRRPDALTALAAAALVVLVDRPWSIFEPSFQLSFAAAAALSALGARWARGGGWVRRMFFASLAATLATAPLSALHFGVVQPAGLIANFVVVPLAELVVLPLGLVAAITGGPLVDLAGWAAARVAELVLLFGRWSPVLEVPPPTSLELAALAAALLALASRPRWALVPLGLTAASIAVSLIAPRFRGDTTVTFLDVGQGDAAVIEAPGGETWLIDAGGRLFGEADAGLDPGEQAVWPFLRARRVRRLELVVVSHPHPDHYGGLAALAAHLPIDELWISGDDPHDPRWDALVARLAGGGTRVVTAPAGTRRERGGARLTVLAPVAPDEDRSVNDDSLVARLDVAGRSILFAGDLEAIGEGDLVAGGLAPVDLVKVPHHGSRTSSTEALVAAARPTLAIVSCGRRNRFRFPAAEVVARWSAAGARVLRTDEAGAITVVLGRGGAMRYSRRVP